MYCIGIITDKTHAMYRIRLITVNIHLMYCIEVITANIYLIYYTRIITDTAHPNLLHKVNNYQYTPYVLHEQTLGATT